MLSSEVESEFHIPSEYHVTVEKQKKSIKGNKMNKKYSQKAAFQCQTFEDIYSVSLAEVGNSMKTLTLMW